MNITSTEQAKGGIQVTQPILQANTEFRATDHLASDLVRETQPSPRHVGYGLPCAKCGTYYMADQAVCPICKCGERISPTVVAVRAGLQNAPPDARELELEDERRNSSHSCSPPLRQINASFGCSLEENHQGGHEPAAICRLCYDHLQERADLMEAALHIDLKEAAQIVYDAVWSDPSDPSKTYQNAAQALLTELCERSGITRFPRVRVV
jgi:hypothetical protein